MTEYKFNNLLFLNLLLCLKLGEKNLILKIGNEFNNLNKFELNELIKRIINEINWVSLLFY